MAASDSMPTLGQKMAALRNVARAARRSQHMNSAGVGIGHDGTHPGGGPCLICDSLKLLDKLGGEE